MKTIYTNVRLSVLDKHPTYEKFISVDVRPPKNGEFFISIDADVVCEAWGDAGYDMVRTIVVPYFGPLSAGVVEKKNRSSVLSSKGG